MASGIFAVLDDVAILMDDVAVMSKVAAKKAAGLLGDDLAVNAEKATGFKASRELPVIWEISKGALLNKLIILPAAFLLSALVPSLIIPILLIGGAYLSYEGAEKVYEWFTGHKHKKVAAEVTEDPHEIVQLEKSKIKSAIRTDFILSIEIVFITLETVMEQSLPIQFMVVSIIALLATVGVYGLVAFLVRMDDTGRYLLEKARDLSGLTAQLLRNTGKVLIASLPRIIRLLSVIGTIAMLLVGGGMYVHNIDALHHALEFMPSLMADFIMGMIVGTVLLLLMYAFKMIQKPDQLDPTI